MSAVVAKIDPGSEKRAQIYQTKQQLEGQKKIHSAVRGQLEKELAENMGIPGETISAETREQIEKLGGGIEETKQQLFELQPTSENLESLYKTKRAQKEMKQTISEYDKFKQKQKKAQESLKMEQERVGRSKAISKRQPFNELGGNL